MDIDSWSGTNWKAVSENVDLELGTMSNLAELPPKHIFYFRVRIEEEHDIDFIYFLKISQIDILAGKTVNGTFTKFNDINIDYYAEGNSCLQFSYVASVSQLSAAESMFSGITPAQIEEKNQLLNDESGTAKDNYLYLKLEFLLSPLQAIIKSIPVAYMPYALVFKIKFEAEVRTVA